MIIYFHKNMVVCFHVSDFEKMYRKILYVKSDILMIINRLGNTPELCFNL
jgi:hypothetical protein